MRFITLKLLILVSLVSGCGSFEITTRGSSCKSQSEVKLAADCPQPKEKRANQETENSIPEDPKTPEAPKFFISTWQTNKGGASLDNQIKLPLDPDGTYNFVADWGDDTSSTITSWDSPLATHTYPSPGVYTVKISGTIVGFNFSLAYRSYTMFVPAVPVDDREKIINIGGWGPLRLGNAGQYFSGAINLNITAQDALDLTGTTSLDRVFESCTSLTGIAGINSWDVSKVTNMNSAFAFNQYFNEDISKWDVSKAETLVNMFQGTGMTTANYDALLIAWSKLPSLVSYATFSGGNARYSASAAAARSEILSKSNWIIMDGGQTP